LAVTDTRATKFAWSGLGLALSVPVILALDGVIRGPLPGGYYAPFLVMLAQPLPAVAAISLGIVGLRRMERKQPGYWVSVVAIALSVILLLLWALWLAVYLDPPSVD
jgi:hypothetical protein